MKDLDEAIQHCLEVANENREYAEDALDRYNLVPNDITKQEHDRCKQCAEDHEQLAEWLKDYKRLKEQGAVLDKIRVEVMNLTDGEKPERVWNVDVLQIIDKYMAESEGT